MAESFQGNVAALMNGMENFVTSKTCVGEPVTVGDTIIVPLVDVSFGVLTSAKSADRRNSGGGGMGGKMSPSALLIIKNGTTRLINIKNQDSVSKIIDIAPDIINRFMPGSKTTPEEEATINEVRHNEEKI